MFQTSRRAHIVASVMTFAQLLVSMMKREAAELNLSDHQLLRTAARVLMQDPLEFSPLFNHAAVATPIVDVEAVPVGARLCRKRPAAESNRRARALH